MKKTLLGLREGFHVDVKHGGGMTVQGNFVDLDYKIERDGKQIADVSKTWLRSRDTYGVEVGNPADVVLLVAVTVAVDALAHDRHGRDVPTHGSGRA